jgi:Ca-activated chloride channel family protein
MNGGGGFLLPEMLWLLALLPPLLALWSLARRRRQSRLARWIVRDNWPLLADSLSPRARFHKGLLLIAAVALCIVAAARPWWGTTQRTVQSRGVNLFLAVDVSESMLAADVLPNRLESARNILRQVLVGIRNHRVGLIPFAGEAFLQVPLTNDHGIVLDALKALNIRTVSHPGTNIPEVIDVAIRSFEASRVAGERVIVLLTDGEDHSGDLEAAAKRAAEKGIRIYALGIGSTDGAPIILPDGRFKQDRDGIKVLSRMNPAVLDTLAAATGGAAYVAAGPGSIDPRPLIDQLAQLEQSDLGERTRVVRHERFHYPLALALLCLLAEGLIPERRRRPDNRRQEGTA